MNYQWKGWKTGTAIAFLWMILASCSENTSPDSESEANAPSSKLEQVQEKGSITCGVNGRLPGFSFVDTNAQYSGMDVDFCRAVAAALFDNPDAVKFRDLSTQERLEAVQKEEVDLLSRNTTWTMSRDTFVGLEFAPILFYDGQGIMVSKSSQVQTIQDLEGKSICVQSGTTTELNLADHMRQQNISYEPVVFDDVDAMYEAYESGRCEGATSDRSQLVILRAEMKQPSDHLLLPDVLSKEPLAPVVKNDDSPWFDTVKWVAYALIQAEEFGITSENLSEFLESEDPRIRRFLGLEGTLGEDMGLSNDFVVRIIQHVGNYGEIYEQNLGEPFGLDRGLNNLWTNGGLLYAPPFR
ncbi:MAG: amino acid ABC transporter substrate-binding protein [Limnothrix sp. RL_2_0]|nr:amino acid ABC transporter substrate-binding protein [Limnothrix sp. RL_2_0]